MGQRGRPKMSEEAKEAAKAERESKKAIHDWFARLPSDPEARADLIRTYVAKLEGVAAEMKEIRDEAHLSGALKRLTDIFGLRKPAIKMAVIMEKLATPEEQTAVWRQLQMIASDRKWDSAPDLFDISSVGTVAPDEGSIFDKTGAGQAQAAERGDDPGRANKRRGKGEPPPAPKDTGKLTEAEAEAAFKAANAKSGKFNAEEDDEADLRPRFMRQGDDALDSVADKIH